MDLAFPFDCLPEKVGHFQRGDVIHKEEGRYRNRLNCLVYFRRNQAGQGRGQKIITCYNFAVCNKTLPAPKKRQE